MAWMFLAPNSEYPTKSWGWPHQAVLGGLLVLSLGLGWWTRAPEVSTGGDEATYLLLSESLSRGHYRDEFLLGTPPHAQYPPGNPAWVAAIHSVAGLGSGPVQAANLLLLALTSLLIGDAVRRIAGTWPGVAAAGLTALNPALLRASGTALSETPFVFLASLSLWATLRFDGQRRHLWVILTIAAAVGAFLTRSAGLALLGGIGVWLLLRKEWRLAVAHGLVSLAIAGSWFSYTRWAASFDLGLSYGQDLEHLAARADAGPHALVRQFASNAAWYAFEGLPWTFGVPGAHGSIPVLVLQGLVLILVVTIGFVALSRRWPAAAGYFVAAVTILLIWPWREDRLLVPLVPLLITIGFLASSTVLRLRPTRLVTIGVVLMAGLVGTAGLFSYLRLDRFRHCNRTDPYADRGCYPVERRDFVAAARFIRDSLPPEAVVVTAKPATVHYFSRRQTVRLPRLLRDEERTGALILNRLGADIILLGHLVPIEERAATMLRQHCSTLEVRATFSSSTLVLAPKGTAGPADACEALERYGSATIGR